MCLLSCEQPAWSWCSQTFRGCEEIEPWPEVFYQPLCLNSQLRKDQFSSFGKYFFFIWYLWGLPAQRLWQESIFVWLVFRFNTARKQIGKCYYFSLSQADVLWVCSAGGKVSEIPYFALQRAKSWCNHLSQFILPLSWNALSRYSCLSPQMPALHCSSCF